MWPLQQEKGRVTGAIIDLVSLSGHCVLDPLPDRMTVFGFVLARDEHDQHGALLFSDRISVRNRPPLDFILFYFFLQEGLGPVHRPLLFGALDLGVEGLKPSTTGPSGFLSGNCTHSSRPEFLSLTVSVCHD